MTKKAKETLVFSARDKMVMRRLPEKGEPMTDIQVQQYHKRLHNGVQYMQNAGLGMACRVTVPMVSKTQVQRASRGFRALSNELNDLVKRVREKKITDWEFLFHAQHAVRNLNHELKLEAGADPKTGAFYNIK